MLILKTLISAQISRVPLCSVERNHLDVRNNKHIHSLIHTKGIIAGVGTEKKKRKKCFFLAILPPDHHQKGEGLELLSFANPHFRQPRTHHFHEESLGIQNRSHILDHECGPLMRG